MGAGKTVFVQGLAEGLGITSDAPVVSPTFTIARSYEVEDSLLELHHVDAYRLTGVEDLDNIGFEEMCGNGRITCVEWASRVEDALPEDRVDLWIEMLPMDEPYVRGEAPRAPRRLRFVARGAASARWLEALDDARLEPAVTTRSVCGPAGWAASALLLALLLPWSAMAGESDPERKMLFLGADGRPLRQVVLAYATREDGAWVLDTATVGEAIDLDAGLLSKTALPPGDPLALVAWGDGLAATHIGSSGGDGLVGVRLLPAGPLAGRVRFARGRPAVASELVATSARADGLVHRTRTAADGTWRFPWLAAGAWTLALRREDGRRQDLGLFVAGQQDEPSDLVVERGGSATALILDGDASTRTPAPGIGLAFAMLPPDPDDERGTVVTGADGTARLDGLEGAVYELRLTDPAYLFDPAPPRFEALPNSHLRLPASFVVRKRAVTGRVEGPRGEGIEGATVEVVADATRTPPPGGWALPAATRTDASGAFRVENLIPDAFYRFTISARGFAPRVSNPIEVRRGRDVALPSVRLVRGWRIEVRAQTAGGRPVEGVRVVGYPASHPVGRADTAWQALARADVTDAEGRAVLPDLAAEDARVVAGGGTWLEVTSIVPYPRSGDVRLFNAAMIRSPRLDGRVTSEAPDGLPPVRVVAMPRDGGARREVRPASDGTFRLDGLAAVPTDLVVYSATGVDGPPLARYEAAMPGESGAVTILVPALLRIAGRVVDAGREATEVAVELEAPLLDVDDDVYRWRTVARRPVTTQVGGAPFAFGGLAPGAYAIRLVRGALDSEALPVLLDDGSVEDLTLELPAGGRVAGTILDARDRPRLGADVRLVRLRGDGDPVGEVRLDRRRASDADGTYVFDDVAPGLWRIEARDRDSAPHVEVVRVDEGESTLAPDIVLGEGGSLRGRVSDPAGRGLDGARLRLESLVDGVDPRDVRTGEDGRFVVPLLATGLWRVTLDAPAGPFTGLEALAEIIDGETTEIDLAAPGRGRIQGTVRRRGRPVPDVVVRLVGQGEEDEDVLRRLVASTDVRGEFYWDGLVAGAYAVDVVDGVVRSTRALHLEDGGRLDLDLEVWDARIVGRVVNAQGRGVPGAEVEALPREDVEGHIAARTRTDPEGRFVLAGLPAGGYDLSAAAPGRPPGVWRGATAEVPPAESAVTIVLGLGGTLDVDVLNMDGRGIAGASIWLEDEGGRPLHPRAFPTTGSGRLRLLGVPVGPQFVRVEAPRYGRVTRSAVVMREAEVSQLIVRLGPPATLALRVELEGAAAARPTRIIVARADTGDVVVRRRAPGFGRGRARERAISRTGRVVIDDLGAGDYVVRIEAGSGFEPLEERVTLEAGEDTFLDLLVAERGPEALPAD